MNQVLTAVAAIAVRALPLTAAARRSPVIPLPVS